VPAAAKRIKLPIFEVRESPIAGLGVFAARRIRRGTRVIEYLGERISSAEADERYDDDAMTKHHTVLFAVDDDTVIDAAVNGNEARFINHACAPNCEAVNEDGRIFIEAIADIPAGAELVYDYSLTRDEPWDDRWAKLYACRCGAPGCRGTILKSPKPPKPSNRKRQRPAASGSELRGRGRR
jgi:SET domain-containing protein